MAEKFLDRLRLSPRPGSYADSTKGLASNPDIDPVPRDSPERKWTWPSMLGFWVAEAFNISMYQVGAASIGKGLNPGLAVLAVFIGHSLVVIPVIANSYIGAVYGINFPVLVRSTFGVYGAYFAVFVRGIVAVIWFGTQSFQGGQCLQTMIEAIWPSFVHFQNTLPASAHVTSAELLCFFLFIIVQLPLLWLHVSSLRYLFLVKGVVMPIFGLTLFIWALVAGHGFGKSFSTPSHSKTGTPITLIFFQCVNSAIGPKATLALNMPDFTRYTRNTKSIVWTQLVGLLFIVTCCGLLGATVTSATMTIYGKQTWNPLEVSKLWNNRAAQFFSALCWAFAVIGTNISANSVSFSNDISLCFPKWINTRRGAYICCFLSIAATPWNIQHNAVSFTAFLGSYSVFLGPISGIMFVDFYILRSRRLVLSSLYRHPDIYSYFYGLNPRAFGAFLIGIALNMPGLAATVGQHHVPSGLIDIYSMSWLVGTVIAGIAYWIFGKIWPMTVDVRNGVDSTTNDDGNIDGPYIGIGVTPDKKNGALDSMKL